MKELFGWLVQSFFEGIVEGLFLTVVFSAIGFTYLYLRYWSQVKVQQVLVREYDSSYANAGQVVVLNTIAGVGILLALALLCAPLANYLNT